MYREETERGRKRGKESGGGRGGGGGGVGREGEREAGGEKERQTVLCVVWLVGHGSFFGS